MFSYNGMDYETVIGLEVHIELLTKTKIFCACSAAFGGEPNTHTCPVCTGQPGSLPVLNRRVVELAAAVGLALNCTIEKRPRFDRKNYFYPDNPQNYQISQLYAPLCQNGFLHVETEEGEKRLRIHEIHMEEDAGKLLHSPEGDVSFVDYNRAGVPLIEIVTEPDMRNADEVLAFLEKLRLRVQYLGASDCRMNEGSLRVDVNLSLRKKGEKTLGTRTEMKNLNSFRAVKRAIEAEALRQAKLLSEHGSVEQETRRWDDGEGVSYPMRSKEDVSDYRYFPEPDLPGLILTDEWIEDLRKGLPEFREEKRRRFVKDYGLTDYDAGVLTASKDMADFFETTAALCNNPKKTANWLMGETLRLKREAGKTEDKIPFSPEHLAKLIRLTEEGKLNSTLAKEVFFVMFREDKDPLEEAEERGLLAVTDEETMRKQIKEVLSENPGPVEQYRSGTEKVFGFLVGQTMKKLKGKGDPAVIQRILKEEL